MTALAGVWRFGAVAGEGECARMLAAQSIYGPDGANQRGYGEMVLGRSLFRILPEDRFDRQPLSGGGGRFGLVADVRLDNREELAEALGIEASRKSMTSDAEFLLLAWERWQEDVFDHLHGGYAFALWDNHLRRLFLARDPMGERPLHYHRGANFVAFASMPKGLHALPEVPYGPDEERVSELLGLIPEWGSHSYFEAVSKVEPGQVAILTPELTTVRRHWQPRRETLQLADADDYAEALREQLDRAVAVRLRGAEGGVGAHLSGGRDSAAVAATAARLLAPSGGTVTGFTAVPREGYDGPVPRGRIGDEGPLAASTAALHPNMEHVLVRPSGSGMIESLDRNFFLYERPLLNLCNLQWIEAINAAARDRGLRVLLTGQMGNMTISYSGWERLPELAACGSWLRLLRECTALVRAGRVSWAGALAASFGPWLSPPVWRGLHRVLGRNLPDFHRSSSLKPERRRALAIDDHARRRAIDPFFRPSKDSWETRVGVLRRADAGNYNKGMMAGWGLDIRDPTADRRLVEFCLSVPLEQYLSGGVLSSLGARAFKDRLPPEILEGRRKGLQAIDWHESLTTARPALRAEIARLFDVAPAAEVLDLSRMARLIENWPSGDWNSPAIASEYRVALLRGAASGHFLRKASRSNA